MYNNTFKYYCRNRFRHKICDSIQKIPSCDGIIQQIMHIVIISEYLSSERYIVERIRHEFQHTTVVIPDYSPENGAVTNTYFAGQIKINSLIQRVYDKLYRIKLARKMSIEKSGNNASTSLDFLRVRLNTATGIETIQNLEPDILITCTAPIIDDKLTQIAKIASWNIHYGIAPYYRGNHTLFWSLYFDDFEKIGGCIHQLSKGVDKGNIIAEVYPALAPGDTELEIEVKVARLLADTVVNLLHHLIESDQSPTGTIQSESGRNFKRVERTLGKVSNQLIKQLLRKPSIPYRESKVIQHY